MPGLTYPEYDVPGFNSNHAEPITSISYLQKPTISSTMATNIKFIPPQMDTLAGTTTEAARKSPLRLLMQDARVLSSMLRYLPWIFVPFRTSDKDGELYMSVKGTRDMILQSCLFIIEAVLLFLAPIAIFALPGSLLMLSGLLCSVLVYVISMPMQGPRIVYSSMDQVTTESAKDHEDERWLFINGCITGHNGLQNNVNRLAKTFGRPVVGIHNQTYGLVVDILECLIQRCLSFSTMDVRVTFDYVKACLADPSVSKVVLIGHSQGGLIASLVLDRLFTDLPIQTISKLEIYTFGSAASHFNNPRLSILPPSYLATRHSSSVHPLADRSIANIEHYCNEYDMIPRWGVLYNVMEVLDNRYSGKVFVRMGATGHLFNQHYMDPMFPLDKTRTSQFLDQVVDVDEKLAARRESKAVEQMNVMRSESSSPQKIEFGDGETIPVGAIVTGEGATNGSGGMLINFIEPNTASREAKGKTVRQLSRLWRYTDGGSPPGPEMEVSCWLENMLSPADSPAVFPAA